MRIGGDAAFFGEIASKQDAEEAVAFAKENQLPLLVLGGGSNTIFADGTINAVVVRIKADSVEIQGQSVTIETGKNLPALINELAKEGLDLSSLTGILGTVGGAVFGNAGQGPKGVWIDAFVETIEAYVDGEWKIYTKEECAFAYRESFFKHQSSPPIIWSTTLTIPTKSPEEIQKEIERLLQKRIDTQPHVKTAGSCFKAVGATPAWQLIDAAGLRETTAGGVHISPKHANFLINDGSASFADATEVVRTVQSGIPEDLEIEMRFVNEDGSLEF